jgi:PPM family protein phosphatase
MIRVENSLLPVVAQTHPGMKGKNNEDRYGVSAFQTETQPPVPILLAVLSDGIGGHRAGEVASELAVDVISQYVAESDGLNPTRILQEAIHLASDTIHQQAQENNEQHGMGATCACAWVAGDRLYTATVGDSRIYLMRGEQILQLSTDHTWIQEALEHGLIQPDQVSGHPNAHVIRRYLGSPSLPEVDFRMRVYEGESDSQSITNQGMRLEPNDRLLLCSDGLTDLVAAPEIMAAFQQWTMEEATAYLVDLANQRGGHDNITIVVIQMPAAPPKRAVAAPVKAMSSLSRFALFGCLGAIILGVLAGGVFGGWIWINRNAITATPGVSATLPGVLETGTITITVTARSSRTPTPTGTSTAIPLDVPTQTPTSRLNPPGPTLTPWPTNTPSTPLPVVTVVP